jgi:hypothetical protein
MNASTYTKLPRKMPTDLKIIPLTISCIYCLSSTFSTPNGWKLQFFSVSCKHIYYFKKALKERWEYKIQLSLLQLEPLLVRGKKAIF